MGKQAEANKNLLVFNITERGSSHASTDTPCQDYSTSRVITDSGGTNWALVIVADGVGSCINSMDGSRAAVTAAEQYITEVMEGTCTNQDSPVFEVEVPVGIPDKENDGKTAETTNEASDEMPEEPKAVPDEISKPIPDGSSDGNSDVIMDETSDMTAGGISDLIPGESPDVTADGVSDAIMDKASDVEPEEVSDTVPDRISGEVSGICSDDISGSVPSAVPDILREAFRRAEDAVLDEAADQGMPPITFDTTLTAALYNGKTLYYGHIGDGGIVAMYADGTYELVTPRLKGEEANSVIPLRMEESWVFAKVNREVVSFAVMTDGILDRNVGTSELNHRVYFPFFSFALSARADTPDDAEEFVRYYRSHYMENEYYRTKVTDDMSFAAAQNITAVKMLSRIIFDKDRWNAESAAFEKEKSDYLKQQALERAQKQNGKNTADG